MASFLGSSSIDIGIGIGIDDFGLEIDQLNQLPLRDIGEIPLLHGNLVLGDIRLQGNLVMVLGVSPGITISSGVGASQPRNAVTKTLGQSSKEK